MAAPGSSLLAGPDDPRFARLVQSLADRADGSDASGQWVAAQLADCWQAGVLRWFVPPQAGGSELSDVDQCRALVGLSRGCLATAFAITQPIGCLRRVVAAGHEALMERVVGPLLAGEAYASVGISHLTTSRRHLAQPVVVATATAGGYRLDGTIPWVTGASSARWIVTGATLADGRQLLLVLPLELRGVRVASPARMIALGQTHTAPVECQDVQVGEEWVLAGPVENVLASTQGAGTGGWQTSALAVGVAEAAIEYLQGEAGRRPNLEPAAAGLQGELDEVTSALLSAARQEARCSSDELRAMANSLVLRSTQAALTAAKGAGYLVGHPAGRWCREALFFLVWSCPQPVAEAALCELAGLSD